MKRGGQSGFTLIQLMMTIMIVSLLATVGTPLLTNSLVRARSSEARAALGAVRRAMRMHYVEQGTYRNPQFTSGRKVTFGGILTLNDVDLEGRYFSNECYTFERVKRRTFRIKCDGAASTAPAASDVADIILFINQTGDIWTGVPTEAGPSLHLAVPLTGGG
jgi:prepilin-type N-terminal cleavage/methylation domain-containing protein